MSLSISQGIDKVGITVESDPLAAKKANNLNDLQSISAARTNLGLAYATDIESLKGDSSSLTISPYTLNAVNLSPSIQKFFVSFWAGATAGGGTAVSVQGNQRVVAPNGVAGYGVRNHTNSSVVRGGNIETGSLNFSKKVSWAFRTQKYTNATSSDAVCRIILGKQTTASVGDPTFKSIGIMFTGNSVVKLMVHDGTTLRTIDTTFTPAFGSCFDCVIVSDGAGNATLSINGIAQVSTTFAPTGLSQNPFDHRVEAETLNSSVTLGIGAYYANQTLIVES